jgi:hypothetical protein
MRICWENRNISEGLGVFLFAIFSILELNE